MRRSAQVTIAVLLAALFAQPVLAGTRQISLSASPRGVTYGSAVELAGQITTSDGETSCISDVEVTLLEDPVDDAFENWQVVGYDRTDDQGRFRELVSPSNSASYRAEVEDHPSGCGAASSNELSVRVRLAVDLAPIDRAVRRGELARLRVAVKPLCREVNRSVPISLYRFRAGRFKKVASKRPGNDCRTVFRRTIRDTSVFQARAPRVDGLHWLYLAGRSTQQVVGVAR